MSSSDATAPARASVPGSDCHGAPPAEPCTLAVVIPAYNEAATIYDVVTRTLRHVESVIVVDDGSDDGTSAALDGLPVAALRNSSRLGKAASLRRGIAHALAAGASAVITLDGDGQHAPEDIPRFVKTHLSGPARIVIGTRLHEHRRIPPLRYFGNRVANFWISWAAGCVFDDSQSGFRLYPATVLRALQVTSTRSLAFVFESEVLIDAARAGVQSVAVPIAAIYRPDARASHFRPVRDVVLIARMVAWKIVSRAFNRRRRVRGLQRSHPVLPMSRADVQEGAEHV